MADNVTANAGTGGSTFATDDISGVHYPRSKVVWGSDGVATDTADSGGSRLPVKVGDALPAGTNNIGDVDVLTMPGVVGDVAHDASDSGNPLKIGGVARTTDPTAVSAAGDRVNFIGDTLGKQVVLLGAVHDRHTNGKGTFTNSTAADLIAAAGSGVKIVITNVLVTNAHATVGTKVEIRDGTTMKVQGFAAAGGGGFALSPGVPIMISTANTAITGRCATTGADVDIFVSGYTISN
jgi:hypothetical protein